MHLMREGRGQNKHVVVFEKLDVCSHIGDLEIIWSAKDIKFIGTWPSQTSTHLLHVHHDKAIHFGILLLCAYCQNHEPSKLHLVAISSSP